MAICDYEGERLIAIYSDKTKAENDLNRYKFLINNCQGCNSDWCENNSEFNQECEYKNYIYMESFKKYHCKTWSDSYIGDNVVMYEKEVIE